MADKQKRWVIYYDETLENKMKRLQEYTAKKDYVPVDDVAVSQVMRALIEEKFVEVTDKQNNRSRLTTVVEGQAETTQELIKLRLQQADLTAAILKLVGGNG